jgi:hypothetical protein
MEAVDAPGAWFHESFKKELYRQKKPRFGGGNGSHIGYFNAYLYTVIIAPA